MRASRALLPVCCLAGGLLLGLALGASTRPRGDGAVHAAGPGAPHPRPAPQGARPDRPQALPAGAALPASRETAARRTSEPSPRRAAGVLEQALALDGPLAAHLRRLLDEGLLEQHFARNPEGWEWLVMEVYLGTGQARYALELFRERGLDEDYGPRIARLLRESGRPGLAAEALADTLARASWRQDVASDLAELDPGRAIAVLRQALDGQDPPGMPATRMRLAEVLARSGSRAEALSLVAELFEREEADEPTWDLLRSLDPADMERRLLQQLQGGGGNDWHRERLAGLLLEQGRREEARATLDQVLANGTGTPEARRLLRELDPVQGVAFLEEAARRTGDAGLWSELGEERRVAGDAPGAIEAWLAAFRQSPGDNDWCRKLEEHAFDQLIGEFDRVVRETENDELWGDLGDSYRRGGRLQDALGCYDRAHAIDPADSEWTGKQAQLRAELGL